MLGLFYLLDFAMRFLLNVILNQSKPLLANVTRIYFILVEFFAPWCQVCREFEPQFESAANMLVTRGVACAKVEKGAGTSSPTPPSY
jgi:thiol-disulfide isomerase/thioredoxin